MEEVPKLVTEQQLLDVSDAFIEIHNIQGRRLKNIEEGLVDVPGQIIDLIGTDSLRLFIDSSEGDLISADNLQTTLTATVERYFNDFTNEVVSWQWFRESGDTQEDRDSDAMWSVGKTSRIIHLTAADFTPNIYNRSIIFTCQAIVQNQRLTTQTAIG